MANQPRPDRRHISMRVDVHICRAIEKAYRRNGDDASRPFIRALEDVARDVVLTAEDIAAIREEIKHNEEKIKGRK